MKILTKSALSFLTVPSPICYPSINSVTLNDNFLRLQGARCLKKLAMLSAPVAGQPARQCPVERAFSWDKI
jgi:hypothetical protein